MKKVMLLAAAVLVLAGSGCGRTLIKAQGNPSLSAVTMYMDFRPFVLDSVEITSLSTGKKYSNRQYGWGKEFFDSHYRFKFLAIGDVPAGEYCISEVRGWTVFDGEKRKKEFMTDLPSDACRFTVTPSDICYVGRIVLIVVKPEATEEFSGKLAALDAEKSRIRGKMFPSELVGYGRAEGVRRRHNFGIIWECYEDGSSALRPGEKEFLDFFESKGVGGWGRIASEKKRTAGFPQPAHN